MQKLTIIFCVLTYSLLACTKEKSIENGGGAKQSLLVKTVARLGNDSLVDTYGYDGGNRLINYTSSIHIQGNVLQTNATFERDGSGVIKTFTLGTNQSPDQVVYTLNHNGTQYTSAIASFIISGQNIKDSTAFTYDGGGRLTQKEEFYDNGFSAGYVEAFKTAYAYDGNGNVIKATYYEYDEVTGTYNATSEVTYEYDTKVNPLRLGIEAFLLDEAERSSASNATKMNLSDITDPTQNETITISYTYNNDGRPSTASLLYSSVGVPFPTTFYYQ